MLKGDPMLMLASFTGLVKCSSPATKVEAARTTAAERDEICMMNVLVLYRSFLPAGLFVGSD